MSRGLCAVVVMFLMSFPALAGGGPDDDVRFIIVEGRETSSTCIGNPVTPVCALETHFACSLWDDDHLCGLLGPKLRRGGKKEPVTTRIEFIIDEVLVLSEADLPKSQWNTGSYRVGYADITYRQKKTFSDGTVWPLAGWSTFTAIYEPVNSHWHYESMMLWGTDDFAEQ